MRLTSLALALSLALTIIPAAFAQLPLPGPKKLDRLPDDNVEGMTWEYEGTIKGTPKADEKDLELAGKFRLEGTAIFDVSPSLALPTTGDVKKTVKKVIAGKKVDLKLPSGPQQNRLGEYRKISNGKYRLDFKEKDSPLNGIMIIQLKKGSSGVWIGTFDQREGTKTLRTWDVELRAIDD